MFDLLRNNLEYQIILCALMLHQIVQILSSISQNVLILPSNRYSIFFWWQLPERLVDSMAIRQQLLSQYDVLQSRIKELKETAENEVLSLITYFLLLNVLNLDLILLIL